MKGKIRKIFQENAQEFKKLKEQELINEVENSGCSCGPDREEKRKINKEDLTNTAMLYAEKEGISLKKAKRIVGLYYSEPRPVVA